MFKSKLLDICLQLQTNEKDKERCHELFNEISDLKNFMIESINLSTLIIFISLIFIFYLILKKTNIFH
tara:strand:- start:895 stop:1098 length:204 start_codon:yes stop_codon:yes gene_type:complete